MVKESIRLLMVLFVFLFFLDAGHADEKKPEGEPGGMPPAQVVVAEVSTGMVAPEAEFIGTVFFQEVSDVASEVSGVAEEVTIEDGQKVKKGDLLVRANSDLLVKSLQATWASHGQALSELEQARTDLERTENLIGQELISRQRYDDSRFKVGGLENKAASLQADVERLEVELQKKEIRAPFDGVVIQKHIDRGEWIGEGKTVATIARDDTVDIRVEVPETVIQFIRKGMSVSLRAGGQDFTGKVLALIPKGDIASRTFPVKVRARNTHALMEGMEAGVTLPTGRKGKMLTVPRDAVARVFGQTAVFAVIDARAKMFPATVVGYQGMMAGISAAGLEEGMKVVIKGNERIRDGQAVAIQQ